MGTSISTDRSYVQHFGYEKHHFKNPEFPISFHKDTREKSSGLISTHAFKGPFITHWHENIELLYIIDGSAKITCGSDEAIYEPGDTAVINSGKFHFIEPIGETVVYYCLIVSRDYLAPKGIDTDSEIFKAKIRDADIGLYMDKIEEAFHEKRNKLYKMRIMSFVTLICERLYTYHRESEDELPEKESASLIICKKIMKYINKNFDSVIDISDIAKNLGVSKFYMCRCFKACTGYGIVEFANIYKTERAKELIYSGKMNVSEAAEHCGFSNLSYFTRVFKKNTGLLPSEVKSDKNQ